MFILLVLGVAFITASGICVSTDLPVWLMLVCQGIGMVCLFAYSIILENKLNKK